MNKLSLPEGWRKREKHGLFRCDYLGLFLGGE